MKKYITIISLMLICMSLMGLRLKGERFALEGVEYFECGNYKKALEYFQKANNSAEESVPEYFFWLAKINLALGDIQKTEKWVNKYMTSDNDEFRDDLSHYNEIFKHQKEIFNEVNLSNMPEYFSSRNSDYSPVLTPDGKYLYFTSLRPTFFNKENIFRSEKLNNSWGKPELVKSLSSDKNEAIGSFSSDGNIAYLFGNYSNKSIDGDIYLSHMNNGEWQNPQPIDNLNTTSIELQPMVYNDSVMFFTSNRNDAIGGFDIYVSEFKNSEWQTPINLGNNVNSTSNEQSPYMSWDGKTLYFASDGYDGFGGYDLYKVVKIGPAWSDWSLPENLGSDINSIKDDRYFYQMDKSNIAYYSSVQNNDNFENIYSLNIAYAPRCYQIYDDDNNKITVLDNSSDNDIFACQKVNVYGIVNDKFKHPIQGEVMFDCVYKGYRFKEHVITDENGLFSKMLPPADRIIVTCNFDGYFIQSKTITGKDKKDVVVNFSLEAMKKHASFVFNNIQFEKNSSLLDDVSIPILDDIAVTLLTNPQVKVNIIGHTCDLGPRKFNDWLSNRRAKRVYLYLIAKGIDKEKMGYLGKGQNEPLVKNDNEEHRKLNRRTEIKVIDDNLK